MFLKSKAKIWFVLVLGLLASACTRVSTDELIGKADQAFAASDYRTAIITLKNALTHEPENARARWLLAEVYLAGGDGVSAQKEVERAQALGIGASATRPALARALFQQGEFDAILELDRDANLPARSAAELHAFRALAHGAKGDIKEAERELETGTALDDSPTALLYARALIEGQRGDTAQAIDRLLALTTDFPQYAEAWTLLGTLYSRENRTDDAIAALSKAIELKLLPVTELKQRAELLAKTGQFDKALDDAARLRTAAPRFFLGHYLTGLVHYRRGDLDAARDALEESASLEARHFGTSLLLASIETRSGNQNRARALAETAFELRPRSIPARKLMALWLIRDEAPAEAEKMIYPVVLSRPEDHSAKQLLGSSLLAQEKYADAAAVFQQLAAAQPDTTAHRYHAGISLIGAGDTQAGLLELKSAAKAAPDDPAIGAGLVAGHLRDNDSAAAVASAQRFLEQNPDNIAALNLVAAAKLASGDRTGALEAYEQALAVDPDNTTAAARIAVFAVAGDDNRRALEVLEAPLKSSPDNLQLLVLQAQAARNTGDAALQRTALQRAVDAHPQNPAPKALLGKMLLDLNKAEEALVAMRGITTTTHEGFLVTRAEANFRLNNLAAARRDLERVADQRPAAVDVHMQLARLHGALGDRAGVEKSLRRILSVDADNDVAQLARVRLALLEGDVARARLALQRDQQLANSDDPMVLDTWLRIAQLENDDAAEIKYAEALFGASPTSANVIVLSRVRERLGDSGSAAELLDQWMQDHPGDGLVLAELANQAARRGNRAETIRRMNALLASDPDSVLALNNLAWFLRDDSPTRAKQLAERAYALAPRNPSVADTYATILAESGELDAALRVVDTLLDTASGEAATGLRVKRSEILYARGDSTAAVSELDGVLEDSPNSRFSDKAKRLLSRMRE